MKTLNQKYINKNAQIPIKAYQSPHDALPDRRHHPCYQTRNKLDHQ
jgi:hypothetical protein